MIEPRLGPRGRGLVEGNAMDASFTEDVMFLAMTFLIAIGLTTAILIWGRVAWGREIR